MRRLAQALKRRSAELVALAGATAWFFYMGYGPTLPVTDTAWMLREDWAAYHWGFAFFRNAPWSFPLGSTPNLFYPLGTSVGFTDANPWASMLFRLVSPLLPEDFQFSGLWFLLCYLLQAWFGTRIAAAFTSDRVLIALSGVLFALTPILPSRAHHIALCGLFFVTAGIALHMQPVASNSDARRLGWLSIALLTWAAGTHGYLSVMLLVLCAALYPRLWLVDRQLSARETATFGALALGATLLVYFLFGYVGWKETELNVEGFGQFAGDLSALINPMGWSNYMADLPALPRQVEGFAYLGVGALALLGIAALLALASPLRTLGSLRRHALLLAAILAMLVYSWSSYVRLYGELMLDLSTYYAPFERLTGIFRSSGRFGWPLHLLLLTAGVAALARLQHVWVARGALLLVVALQVADVRPRLEFPAIPMTPFSSPALQELGKNYAHLALVPMHLQWVCAYNAGLVDRLSDLAYRQKLTFNSGNFMRKEPGLQAQCGRHLERMDARTIYAVEPAYLSDFRPDAAVCGVLDGLFLCVDAGRATRLRDALLAVRLR